jgi:PAS domain S-box-containing protein
MNLKNRFRLFIFSLILLLAGIAVMGTVGVLQTRTHIQEAIGMDELVVQLYALRILDSEYVAAPSERVRQQWVAIHDQIESKLAQQRGIPNEVAEAFKGLEEIFERLAALPEAPPGLEASQRRLRNQIAMSLDLESQRVIDWASEISRRSKIIIVPHLMRIGGALLAAALCVAVAMITIMSRTARRLLSSLTKLKDGAEAIADGTLGFQVELVGSDEIAALGSSVNRMSRDLLDSYERLQVSESQFRSYVEDAPIGIFICDETGRYLEVNPAATLITGYTREELLAVGIPDILPPEAHAAAALAFQEVAGTGRTSAEFAFRCKDGRIGTWSLEGVRLSPTRFMGMVTDITERKRADENLKLTTERLSLAARAGGVGIWDYDLANNRLLWDDEMYRLYGITADEFGGAYEAWKAGLHPEDVLQGDAAIQAAIRGEKEFDTEFRVVWPDGSIHNIRGIALVQRDGSGQPLRMIGTNWDITEQKKAEIILEQKNAEMERFTYMISHDLKSPLVTVQTFLGYLEQDMEQGNAERVAKDMGFIRNATGKMGRLLGDLLEVSRVGRVVNPPVKVSLAELIQDALAAVAGAISTQSVAIQVEAPPLSLLGDRPRLEEIWQNLVENAVKYMGDQPSPRIELGVEGRGAGSVFFVRDNGMGIDPRFHTKVFGLFEKLDATSEGTGLGLALVKRIVEIHEGRIWLESEGLGQGTCVRFTLPLALKGRAKEQR